ncbi:MAG: hypothetical protein Q9216_002855 [Gyalolechia sp. 2 TL-2023]
MEAVNMEATEISLESLSKVISQAYQSIWSLRWLIFLFAILYPLFTRDFENTTRGVKAPIAARSSYEPYFITGLRFKRSSMAHLSEGYRKFKNQMFKIIRLDSMVLIIPKTYVEDLRALPEHRLSLRHLQVHHKLLMFHCTQNLYGKSTTTDVLLQSDLQARMLRHQLTPNLQDFVTSSLEEIEYATEKQMNTSQGIVRSVLSYGALIVYSQANHGMAIVDSWASIKINPALLQIVAGVTTRAMSGTQLCRKQHWLSTCIKYTENIFITVLILRLFPRVLHGWISSFLPSSWITHLSLRRAKKLLVPIINERKRQQASPTKGYEKPLDLLQYMIDGAQGHELDPERLAHLQLLANLAGIHTTSAAITHAIYDLCEHPEYIDELRGEIEEILQRDGGWQKDTHKRLYKFDSFLKESQRFSPPTLLSFNRIALTTLTLSTGITIPAGTHFSVASRDILFDPEVTPNPDTFDGLRYYRMRQASTSSKESHKLDFASADGTNMNFGAGRYACPGRFFASMELKLLLAHLLLKFDFRFPEGKKRPASIVVDEFLGPNPWARVLVRRRVARKV